MRLKTFGGLTLEERDFRRTKSLVLLSYLSLEGVQTRQHLAELFWPSNDNALGNLSMTLSRLRQVAPGILETDVHSVRAHLATDFEELRASFGGQDWENVLKLYEGPFLEGVTLRNTSGELEEWLYEKREQFASLAQNALLKKAEQLAQTKAFKQAAQLATEGYHLRYAREPEEKDLKRIYKLLQADLHPNAKDVQKEAASYGLVLKLSKDEARASLLEAHKAFLLNFPTFPTRFVGRGAEIEKLKLELVKPEVRLLTLLSQGGMGKTRLAVEVGKALGDSFAEGVCFASFVSTPTAEQMPFTLGDALNVSFFGNDSAEVQLLRFLSDKEMLLILDNLEHLLEGARFISELLLSSQKLKVLATSRESSNLQAERIYELKGLRFSEKTDPAQTDSDAANLFIQAAQNRQPEFELNEKIAQDVNKICQLVEGMPLALELSASWLRTLGLSSIVEELEKGVDVLQANTRDLPERHQSIRAVFDYSWNLLSGEEQAAIRKLAVFRGGFSREAAREVTGTSLATLASLIDKSFLSKAGDDRYRRHPLVIQYSQEKLAEHPEEQAKAEEAHASYFLSRIRHYSPKLRSLERKAILHRLEPDFVNIRNAWLWVVREQRVDDLVTSSTALNHAFGNRLDEAAELFDSAIANLDEHDPLHRRALGYALVHRAKYSSYTSNSAMINSAEAGIQILQELNDFAGVVLGLKYSISYFDEWPNGSSPFEKALQLARQFGEPNDIGLFLHRHMLFERNTGNFVDVKVKFQGALNEIRQLEDPITEVLLLVIYGSYLVYNREFEEGISLLKESLRLNQILDLQGSYVGIYVELGYAFFKMKQLGEAKTHFRQALIAAEKVRWSTFQAKAYGYLGRLAILENSKDYAFTAIRKSLELSRSNLHHFMENLIAYAELLNEYTSPLRAVEILAFVSPNTAAEKRDRNQAREILDELKPKLSDEDFDAAVERGKGLELNDVINEALTTLQLTLS